MNPKFEKWSELPTEMQMECVKWMNFKSRMGLRGASKSDKSLVESAPKYHFDSINIVKYPRMARTEFKKTGAEAENFKVEGTISFSETQYKAEDLGVQLLKFASADDFKLADHSWECMDFLNEIGESNLESNKCKNVELDSGRLKVIKAFAEKCENPEKVVIKKTSGFKSNESLDQLINIPAIHNAKILQLVVRDDSYPYKYVNPLIEKWGHRDAELGTTLQLAVNDRDLFSKLHIARNLKHRFIYKKGNEIRLRADNESKHILMRQDKMSGDNVYISLIIIPADQKESEYEKNDQWVEDFVGKPQPQPRRSAFAQMLAFRLATPNEARQMALDMPEEPLWDDDEDDFW